MRFRAVSWWWCVSSRRFFVFSVVRSFVCNIRDVSNFFATVSNVVTVPAPILIVPKVLHPTSTHFHFQSTLIPIPLLISNWWLDIQRHPKPKPQPPFLRWVTRSSGTVAQQRSGTNIIELSETEVSVRIRGPGKLRGLGAQVQTLSHTHTGCKSRTD